MADILQVDIMDNKKGGHDDLIFSIEGLVDKLILDTYYFIIEIEPYETLQDIKNAVGQLLTYWLTEIQNVDEGKQIYLPIDFSDQYTGCLKVLKQGESIQLTYGFSDREGYSINPLSPGDYSTTITDFKDTQNKTIEVTSDDFMNSVRHQIDRLVNAS